MKKFFQSKGFIVSSLALLCVTILSVCWFVSRDRTRDFRPDESPPSSVTGDWSDGGTQTDSDNGADAYAPGQSTDAEEEYPKVTSQTEDEVVIDFTDTEKPEETPPPVPEGKTEIKDPGQEHSSQRSSLIIMEQRRMNMSKLTYIRCGDYDIPNLKLSVQPETSIGKYGRMRKSYLKEHRPILYNQLLMSEKLYTA